MSEDEIKRLGDAIAELSARIQAAIYEPGIATASFPGVQRDTVTPTTFDIGATAGQPD